MINMLTMEYYFIDNTNGNLRQYVRIYWVTEADRLKL